MQKVNFTFTDTIAGYVKTFDWENNSFVVETSDKREFTVKLTSTTYSEIIRNLDEAYVDCTGMIKDLLLPGRYLYAHGIFFPENDDLSFEAKHIVLLGKEIGEFKFEKQDWWIKQIKSLADFYLQAQFGYDEIDYRKYRTEINLEGEQDGSIRQETDTISRLVYGFASAFLLTGDDRYLEAAEKGTEYLQNHMRSTDTSDNTAFWYHGIDLKGNKERKLFSSEFSDDYNAIPAYEQIYALAGPTQTFRITGNPDVLNDIHMTINLFDKYFLDRNKGGYFSHIDPVTFDPRSETIGKDAARKNWNSVGDHAPAYLINAWLATQEPKFEKMLKYTADTIVEHFPDYDNSPFVQEKFFEDWSADRTWGWQQNRAIVGHNLKIAWNLMRIDSMTHDQKYVDMAHKIAQLMPKVGNDNQRGGWYDAMERALLPGQIFNRFAWHDRKTWWQQEQGILAYLILSGITKKEEYLKFARESSSFYNAWFLDHDSGAVYFHINANGLPYLLGTERLKGSHSMSGYHSFELAYLAATYTNLLITKQHVDYYFKPIPGAFKDNILYVQPDILPKGSIRIKNVWINEKEYNDFDADALTVIIPESNDRVKIKVRIEATQDLEHFSSRIEKKETSTFVYMKGDLDPRAIHTFRNSLEQIAWDRPDKVVFEMEELNSITNAGVRTIIFEVQKLSIDTEIVVSKANDDVKAVFSNDEFIDNISFAN